jgi:sugar phosphate permease
VSADASTRGRTRVFSLTWLSYASMYVCRKGYAVSKARLVAELGITEATLAAIDTAYIVAYSLGQFASGAGVERFGGRKMITLGLVGAAAACFAFGLSHAGWALLVFWALNGLFQSTGWPAGTSLMALWYPARERGAAMGLWSTNYQVGGFLGTMLATALLARFGWRVAIGGPGLWLLAVALAIFFLLPDRPPRTDTGAEAAALGVSPPPPGGFRTAMRDPAVWIVATAHVCLKVILYGLMFWTAYWLHTARGYDEATAGFLSMTIEVGGIAGTIVAGRISDLAVRRGRAFVAAFMLLLLALSIGALAFAPQPSQLGWITHALWLAAIGFFLFGPESLVAGAAAQDLGARHGTAVAVGAINGIGSLGGILQAGVTLGLREAYGWPGVFLGFAVIAVVGAAALLSLPLVSRRSKE